MKTKNILSLLLIGLLTLTGCGKKDDTKDTGSSDTTPTDSSTPSIDDTNPTETEAELKLGNVTRLKTHLETLATEKLSSITKSTYYKTSAKETTTDVVTTFKTSEILTTTTITDHKNQTNSISNTYEGIVDKIYYKIELDGDYSHASRSKIVDTIDPMYKDQIIEVDAQENLQTTVNNENLSVATTFNYWSKLFDEKTTVKNYNLQDNTEDIRVVITAWSKSYSNYNDYQFVGSFSKDYKLSSGTLITNQYSDSNWDSEQNIALPNAQPYSTKRISINSITYGNQEETSTTTLIDVSNYFISSLKKISITNFTYDSRYNIVTSQPNKLFPNESVDCPVESIKSNNLFLPSTALDVSNLVITGTSNENALIKTESGWVTGEIGQTATISIGNSFNKELAQIDIEIVDSGIVKIPLFTCPTITPVDNTHVTSTSDPEFFIDKFIVDTSETLVFAVSTDNAGPFDTVERLKYEIVDNSIVEINVPEQSQYFEQYQSKLGKNVVYIEITAKAIGTTKIIFRDNKDSGEAITEISYEVTKL